MPSHVSHAHVAASPSTSAVLAPSHSSSSSDDDDFRTVDVSAYFVAAKEPKFDSSDDEMHRFIAIKKRRLKRRLVAASLLACASMVDAYCRYRGGVQELRNIQIPDKDFDPDSFCDKSFVCWFRFERYEMQAIIRQLNLPDVIISSERDRANTFDVFCLLCAKYAYPMRYCQLVREFGRSASAMSRLIKSLRQLLYHRFCNRLRHPPALSAEECACFASKCRAICGHPIVVGFIDGTVREICKPSKLQGPMYSGKDRVHSLKYQAINTPDGIIRHIAGPFPGSRHDQFMLRESGILDWIAEFPKQQVTNWPHVIYADLGYSVIPGRIEVPFHDEAINVVHAAYNLAMSSARISVEWSFGAILRHWASLRYVPEQQLLSQRKIGQIYFVAAILTNFLSCLTPNQTSQYFNCAPPSLASYLEWLKSS
jgi:nuclease HARBI1